MKLWLKQTLVTLTAVLISVSLCLYWYVSRETDLLIRQAKENGERNVKLTCDYLSMAAAERSAFTAYDVDELTHRAMIQYTFSNTAFSLQTTDTAWSLAMDGRYYFNTASCDPLHSLPMAGDTGAASRIVKSGEKHWLITGKTMIVLYTPITVYCTENIEETYRHIDGLVRLAQLSLVGCLFLCALLLPLILRRTLAPLGRLTRVSEKIAAGEYGLRSRIETGDEVGDLSASFDHMAETLEQKIADLEDTARRREMLLGALTHEIKTPMTAIIGFSDSLLSMPLTEESRLEAAHEIHEAARRTERLSQKMMQMISLKENPAVTQKSLSTRDLMEKVCAALDAAAKKKGIRIQTEIKADAVTGDQDLLFSLLSNLLDNALKASPENGEVRLTVKKYMGIQMLAVTDRGSGIPADQIALVTEPFYRVDKARSRRLGGAGLGLSLCRMIAQAHGGLLDIQSEIGKGAVLSMIWPEVKKEHE